MKNVDQIRTRILRGLQGELARLRIFVSGIEGNADIVERLRGEAGDKILATTTEHLMAELGHETPTKAGSGDNVIRRALSKGRAGRRSSLANKPSAPEDA